METRNLTCIGCPMGCQLKVTFDPSNMENITVEGNTCNIGHNYGIAEVTNPTRVVTGTVGVSNRENIVASVKTKNPIPKGEIDTVAKILREIKVEAPVKIGDVVDHKRTDLGFDLTLVVTREVR